MSTNTNPMDELGVQAELRGEEVTDAVKHLAHPAILEELSKLTDQEQRVALIRERMEHLSDEADELRKQARQAYRHQKEEQFADVDWKRALCGMPDILHRVEFAGVAAFYLESPSGQTEHAVNRFVSSLTEKDALFPVSREEATLLGYLKKLEYVGTEEAKQPTLATDYPAKLEQIRQFASPMLVRLADEALAMATYLGAVLEDELGNS